jgi:succinyl-CoA reductase
MKFSIIGGEILKSDKYINVINPSNEEIIDRVTIADREKTKEAIDLAYESFKVLSSMPLKERCKILIRASEVIEKRKEEIAKILASEAGKPIRDARVEVTRTISLFRIAAEEVRFVLEGKIPRVDAYEYPLGNENRIVMEIREPIGVVGAILPFNFPVNSFAHKVGPNIAAGNTVVVKPSSSTPLSAIELATILYECGLPKGCLSVVVGPASVVGEEIIENRKVSGITFTGSTNTGLYLASKASLTGKRIMMEMGGSDPVIILEDVDLAKVVPATVRARFEYAGQNCNSAKRFFIHEKIYDKFIEFYKENTEKINVGDALSEYTDMGPLISSDAIKQMQEYVEDALNKGSKLIFGGKKLYDKGFFFSPTIIVDTNLDMKCMKEEVFGPIAPIAKFNNVEEAIEFANSTDYGLQAAIFTNDLKKALKIAREIRSGGVLINDSTRLRWDALPFGGVKLSGLGGREGVRTTILNMTEPKIISINLA